MIDRQLLIEWIAALRSGEYNQTTLTLKDNYGFCCLGVACEINNVNWDDYAHNMTTLDILNKEKLGLNIVPSVDDCAMIQQKYNLYKSFYDYNYAKILSIVNDAGKSFTDIADIIEEFILNRYA